ncbi:putative Zn ribbon protein [Bradyrhizobium huanghuaihaiense]
MTDTMKCPACSSEHAYQDRDLWVCPECGHEWSGAADAGADTAPDAGVRDANGNVLCAR